MSAVKPLRMAIDALSRNPVLFLGGLAYAALLAPQRALQLAGVPLAPTALQMMTFVVTPFVVAGVLGMARDALDGDTAMETLTTTGRARYLDLLLASFLEFGIQLSFGVVFVVLGLLLAVAASAAGPVALVGGAVLLVVLCLYLAVLFAIQFYPVIVVVDDADAVESVTQSVSFVRGNVLDTLGYTLVTLVLGLLASLPVAGFTAYRFLTSGGAPTGGTPGPIGGGMSGGGPGAGSSGLDALVGSGMGVGLSTPEVVALALASMATTTLFFAFRHTYATAFYRRNGRSVEERVLDDEP